jgi:hypothetical protein
MGASVKGEMFGKNTCTRGVEKRQMRYFQCAQKLYKLHNGISSLEFGTPFRKHEVSWNILHVTCCDVGRVA